MDEYVLQPSGQARRPEPDGIEPGQVRSALALLDQLPFPVLWIRRGYRVGWANRVAHECYAGVSGKCHAITHGTASPCDRNGELCPMRRAEELGRAISVCHVHEGRAGANLYEVTAVPVRGGGAIELHTSLDEVLLRDALTGLHNRRFFEQVVRRELDLMKRMAAPFSLVLVDLDRLKRINDDLGHPAGDVALRAVGQSIQASLRASDIACRFGGDEFCLFLPDTREHSAVSLARRIRAALHDLPADQLPRGRRVSASFGIHGGTESYDLDAALARADRALYRAKRRGRDRIAIA